MISELLSNEKVNRPWLVPGGNRDGQAFQLKQETNMIRAGFTIDNPLTGSRTLVLEADAEMNSQGWLLESRCQPGAAPDIAEHLHLTWTETFEIISGKAYYKLDGTQHTAIAGESFTVK
jgi:hypothetical protein